MQHALCGKGLFISAVETSMKPVRNSKLKPLAGRQGDMEMRCMSGTENCIQYSISQF